LADPFEHIAGLTDEAEPVESPETAAPSTGRSERSTETNGAALNSVPAAKLIKRIPIVVQPGKFHSIVNQAIKELRAAKVMFFHRAGEIVMPVVDEVATFKGRRTRVVRLKPVGVDLMRYELSQVVNWVKFDGRSKTQIPCDPPLETAKAILACAEQFPRLAGVITTPTLRPDGSLLSSEGYDEATGLLLFDPPLLPEIPENPTREDALEQLKLLEELLDEFPFVDAAAQSVAVSGLMTAVHRGAMQVGAPSCSDCTDAGFREKLLDRFGGGYCHKRSCAGHGDRSDRRGN
jgi:hypothetical protein